ncbi:hypothetical protein COO60DRAFT_558828 [Scenedesmus sp. NREL 46B-D3]|nr:hypothetical protein COO60DRAFT_558828 [Scenedesmus sp. NREL 46B-D3]
MLSAALLSSSGTCCSTLGSCRASPAQPPQPSCTPLDRWRAPSGCCCCCCCCGTSCCSGSKPQCSTAGFALPGATPWLPLLFMAASPLADPGLLPPPPPTLFAAWSVETGRLPPPPRALAACAATGHEPGMRLLPPRLLTVRRGEPGLLLTPPAAVRASAGIASCEGDGVDAAVLIVASPIKPVLSFASALPAAKLCAATCMSRRCCAQLYLSLCSPAWTAAASAATSLVNGPADAGRAPAEAAAAPPATALLLIAPAADQGLVWLALLLLLPACSWLIRALGLPAAALRACWHPMQVQQNPAWTSQPWQACCCCCFTPLRHQQLLLSCQQHAAAVAGKARPAAAVHAGAAGPGGGTAAAAGLVGLRPAAGRWRSLGQVFLLLLLWCC